MFDSAGPRFRAGVVLLLVLAEWSWDCLYHSCKDLMQLSLLNAHLVVPSPLSSAFLCHPWHLHPLYLIALLAPIAFPILGELTPLPASPFPPTEQGLLTRLESQDTRPLV